MNLNKLKETLNQQFVEEDIDPLAYILWAVLINGTVSYGEIEIPHDRKQEILLFAYYQRLLIPGKISNYAPSSAWEDRVLTFSADEIYEMPLVVQYLVKDACENGKWEPVRAVKTYFESIGEGDIENILILVKGIIMRRSSSEGPFRNIKVTVHFLREIANEMDLVINLDKVIAVLKAGGIISPALHGHYEHGIQYEINPSLLPT